MSSQLQVSGEAKIRDIQGPVVANSGVITALDGAASQYVRGDGTLADFPTSTGGGSSVSYYLNSSVSQGTIGGVAYRELSKEPIIGTGTDIAIAANGYVASYLTDANDPDVLSIPGGNFNCEFYFSVSNDTGNPFFYAELYKYDGTTFTLLGSSVGVPEYINQGTIIAPYYFAIPVPTSALAVTDRLAIRIYVNVDGRTVTLHTENSHLCQVVTTLSKGMVSLNNLTDQSQYLATGTSGTDFNIVSSGDTHTFNIPIASATNTGKLSSTDWSVFNSKEPAIAAGTTLQYFRGDKTFQTLNTTAVVEATNLYFTDARSRAALSFTAGSGAYNSTTGVITIPTNNNQITNGSNFITLASLSAGTGISYNNTTGVIASTITQYTDALARAAISLTTTGTSGAATYNSTTGVFNIPNYAPDLSGYVTIGTTQTITGTKTFSEANRQESGLLLKNNVIAGLAGYTSLGGATNGLAIQLSGSSSIQTLIFQSAAAYSYTLPATSGTIALTSNISYPVTSVFGRTGAIVAVSGDYNTDLVTEGITNLYFTNARSRSAISLTVTGTSGPASYNSTTGVLNVPQYSTDLSGYVTIATTQTITGNKTFSEATRQESGLLLKNGVLAGATGYASLGGASNGLVVQLSGSANQQTLIFQSGAAYSYTLPATSGTLALTSQLTSGTVTSVGLSSATSGVTIGSTPITTSGTITLAIATASGSQNGLLSSTDWTTFNNKQSALTNPVTGTGTTNYLPKFTGASTIGNSQIFDNGTNVGIGISNPNIYDSNADNLVIGSTGANDRNGITIVGGDTDGRGAIYFADTTQNSAGFITYLHSNNRLLFGTSDTTRVTIDASGNLGLGVTPSAWLSTSRVLEIGGPENGYIAFNPTNLQSYIYWNAYYDTDNRYKKSSQKAAAFGLNFAGDYVWYNAPSGTAGNAISFTQAMTLFSTGNLAIGTTTDAGYKLDVNGTGRFTGALSGTSATFSGNLRAASFSNAGLEATEVFNATKSSAGYYVGYFQNTSATGLGLYIRNGLDTNPSIRISNAAGTQNTIELFGTGAATFSSSVTATSAFFNASNGFGLAARNAANTQYRNLIILNSGNQIEIGRDTDISQIRLGTASANDALTIASTGAATFSSSVTISGGNDLIFRDASTYISSPATDTLRIITANTERMRITSGGNVLIGTTTDAGQKLQVNGTASFSSSVTVNGLLTNYNTFNTQTASYTLVLADASKIVETNVASANTVTVPTNASVAFPIGTEITIMQYGAGVTTIASAGGVTINSKSNARIIANRYTGATLVKRGTDEWYLIGNIVP